MKVKPFYIKITDDMTPQIVQDAFDKCVDAGATACESIDGAVKKHKYQGCYGTNFNNFGVNKYNETLLHDGSRPFGGHEQEITIDQLDAHLGINGSEEWKNGDECVFTDRNGDDKVCKVIGLFPPFVESYVLHCESAEPTFFISNVGRMKKPETPQQREEREQLEAAYDLYCVWRGENHESFDAFRICNVDNWLAIVDKTGYRKEK